MKAIRARAWIQLVLEARKQRSWSQEELAIASGLNLRTIQPQQWEYRVVETRDRKANHAELNHAGAEGWELVSATSMFNTMMTKVLHMFFFKRPKADG